MSIYFKLKILIVNWELSSWNKYTIWSIRKNFSRFILDFLRLKKFNFWKYSTNFFKYKIPKILKKISEILFSFSGKKFVQFFSIFFSLFHCFCNDSFSFKIYIFFRNPFFCRSNLRECEKRTTVPPRDLFSFFHWQRSLLLKIWRLLSQIFWKFEGRMWAFYMEFTKKKFFFRNRILKKKSFFWWSSEFHSKILKKL